jgi:hypothetical protein
LQPHLPAVQVLQVSSHSSSVDVSVVVLVVSVGVVVVVVVGVVVLTISHVPDLLTLLVGTTSSILDEHSRQSLDP